MTLTIAISKCDTQQNDIPHNDIQDIDIQHNDNQHNNKKMLRHNGTQHVTQDCNRKI